MSQTIERPTATKTRPAPVASTARRQAVATPRQASLLGDAADDLGLELPDTRARLRRLFVLSPFARIRICGFIISLFAAAILVQLFTLQVQDRYGTKARA